MNNGSHVGGQEQKLSLPLGTKLYFHVNSSRQISIVTWLQTKNRIASRESCLVWLHVIAMAWAPVSTTFRNQGTQIWQKSQNKTMALLQSCEKKDIFLKTNWRNWSQSKYTNNTPNFKSFEIHLRIAAYYQIKLKRHSIYQNWHFCKN